MDGIDTTFNRARYRRGQPGGFYESFFVRANHPSEALAFWVRYTLFQPADRPGQALGELWAIVFDAKGANVAVKQELGLDLCSFSNDALGARVGSASLGEGKLEGAAESGGHRIRWTLNFGGGGAPVLLLPRDRYDAGFPRAKSLVAQPNAVFEGEIEVDRRRIAVTGWKGSQNHNWGARHTDRYAWGQVCGFDDAPDSFLELASAQLRVGPLWTPVFTPIVLRHAGREHALNGLGQSALRARGRFRLGEWSFRSRNAEVSIEGAIHAPAEAFVGLRYYNPPGGVKHCLNSKLAACRLTITDRKTGAAQTLSTKHRAAFELLTDDTAHGVPLAA